MPPSFASVLGTGLALALLLDTSGVVPISIRGLVAGTLFFVSSPKSTGSVRGVGLLLARLAGAAAIAAVCAAQPRFIAFATAIAAFLIFRGRRSRDPSGYAALGASALLLPVAVVADTSRGTGWMAAAFESIRAPIDLIAPTWNGSVGLLQPLPQLFLLFFFSALVFVHEPSRRRALWAMVVQVALVLALNGVVLAFWHDLVANAAGYLQTPLWPTYVTPCLIAAHAVLAAGAIVGILGPATEASASAGDLSPDPSTETPPSWTRRRLVRTSVGAVGGLLVGLTLTHGLVGLEVDDERLQGLRVFIHDANQLEFKSPSHEVLGLYSDGMFGALTDYFDAFGVDTRTGPLTAEALEWAEVAVLINPPEMFTSAQREALDGFVARGRGLLCAGDHTSMEAIRDPLNALLEDTGIQLRFDSAASFQRHWLDSMRLPLHPLNAGFTRQEQTQVWIGCSLELKGRGAVPILVGANAFSDDADLDTPGFLGDLTYNVGEGMGDRVVAAASESKGGRILVFGDTSMLQNTAITWSWAYLRRALLWLAEGVDPPATHALVPFLVLLLAACAGVFAVSTLGGTRRLSPLLLGASLGVLLGGLWSAGNRSMVEANQSPTRNIAFIDRAHNNQFLPVNWGPDALRGLEMSFLREGLIPMTATQWHDSMLAGTRVVAMVAPTRDLDARESRALSRYLESGGLLLLCLSPNAGRRTPRLLSLLGVELGDTPLARPVVDTKMGRVTMYDAHPVRCLDGSAETIATAKTEAVILWKPIGQGGAVITGDPGFWVNKNLEDRATWNAENVGFLWQLLRRHGGTGAES